MGPAQLQPCNSCVHILLPCRCEQACPSDLLAIPGAFNPCLPTLQVVWAVLTDYNQLAEFIPNLAVSQRIALPSSAPPNIIRIRQVGYKRMLYMCLHAESVLDLIEKQQRWGAFGGRGGGLGSVCPW